MVPEVVPEIATPGDGMGAVSVKGPATAPKVAVSSSVPPRRFPSASAYSKARISTVPGMFPGRVHGGPKDTRRFEITGELGSVAAGDPPPPPW